MLGSDDGVASRCSEFAGLAQEFFELSGELGHDRIMTHPLRGHSRTLAHSGLTSRMCLVVCNARPVLTWAELERAAPEITARGRELLERFQFVFVGTLTKNGSPR
jgi:hypothetical protein